MVGIDLGTTNSSVATVDPSGPFLVSFDGDVSSSMVPSLVAFAETSPYPIVGHDARALQLSNHEEDEVEVFHSFKRLIGLQFDELGPGNLSSLAYTIVQGDHGEALVYSRVADDLISPQDLSEYLIAHLVRMVEQGIGEEITGAVVTVPARFSSEQRGATLMAAESAGIEKVHLLQEPVAAALAYGIDGGTDGDTVLVFDLGGGTFDVSVLQAFEGIMEVLGTSGDTELGGDDLDSAIADLLQSRLNCDVENRSQILQAARRAKESLSSSSMDLDELSDAQSPPSGSPTSDWMDTLMAADGTASESILSEDAINQILSPFLERMADVLESLGKDLFVTWAMEPRQAASLACSSVETTEDAAQYSPNCDEISSRDRTKSFLETNNDNPNNVLGDPEPKVSSEQSRWSPPPRRITRVALVGQSTFLPCVRRFVELVTGVQPCTGVDPRSAVALGAAIQAGTLLGSLSQVELMDGSFVAGKHDRASGFGAWQP